jgi:SH3-like domain-containing protein
MTGPFPRNACLRLRGCLQQGRAPRSLPAARPARNPVAIRAAIQAVTPAASRAAIQVATLAAALALLAPGLAQAIDFKSVGAVPAVLYDAPSEKGRKVFAAPRGMPVEVVLTYGEWTKVRDAAGDLAWVATRSLSASRSVVSTVAGARMRASADEAGAVVATLDKGVLLELAEPVTSGWVKVRHRDGQSGYVRAAEVWGE